MPLPYGSWNQNWKRFLPGMCYWGNEVEYWLAESDGRDVEAE